MSLSFRLYDEQRFEEALKNESILRESKWTESIAIGSRQFVKKTKNRLGIKETGRKIVEQNGI
ncbi:hypothetical protein EPICR_40160 [Candidatus Desulfarcum epimagneticum]|uniref:Uncharacterized protein n=1 Tax=uncultured Desulfobacteraceae bacterium TaxID=218296 RepID=A0A484HIJ0_9BACT|nr:hypothetical protein EPICR_40160 [uncultured Desulfobacteraceae bacterium]